MVSTKQITQIYSDLKIKNRQFILTQAEKSLRNLEKLIAHFSLTGNSTFFNPQEYSWVANLESNWLLIREELDRVLQDVDLIPNFQDISPDQYSITQDRRWRTYFFYAYGFKAENNCKKCPETTRLIESIPEMKTAFFSILLPHKHIPEHCGPYKGIMRYHLGLIVPEPQTACRIRVGEDIRYWEAGKSLIFDDTFPHEAWNDTDEIRVVLFVDFIRPMKFPISLINKFIIQLIAWSPYIKTAKTNFQEWENRWKM
jgi:ornithine lipid ester-linked acyl 2-hydroxylase